MDKIPAIRLALLLISIGAPGQSVQPAKPAQGAYVVGNCGIAAQIDDAEGLRAAIKINPPELGHWLEDFATGELSIEEDTNPSRRLLLKPTYASKMYPEYRARFDAESLSVEVQIFAPLSMVSEKNFLPALIIRLKLRANVPWSGKIIFSLFPNNAAKTQSEQLRVGKLVAMQQGRAFLGLLRTNGTTNAMDEAGSSLRASTRVKMSAREVRDVTFLLGYFHENGYYAAKFATAGDLAGFVAARTKVLEGELHQFVSSLPVTGDPAIDRYLRSYVSAAILLTRGLRTGEVLTMGYRELNQRDSFWASGVHLVFWKDLERNMLMESIQGQDSSGRIPTTLLPLIDRRDDIDISEYFVLRVARFYRWYRDDQFLSHAWPAVKKAIAYLASRDSEKVSVPMQSSYWADWKDVPGVEGRTYAPHFALLWLASLGAARELAFAAHDAESASSYSMMEERARDFVNRPFEQGGLWNGANYVDRWRDGREPRYVLEDQVVGAYFGVIPDVRLQAIYERLKANETPYGVRETYPYLNELTEAKGGDPGNYHNGGIWPYLNFVDVGGRYMHGYTGDAERIIRSVGRADLENGDGQPGEFMNGDTGENRGFRVQAWDAALFSAIYFGAFGIDRISKSEIDLHLRIPRSRDFATSLILAGKRVMLSSRSGRLSWKPHTLHGEDRTPITIKVLDERPTL